MKIKIPKPPSTVKPSPNEETPKPQNEKLSTEVKPNSQPVPTIIKDNDIIMTDYDLNSILKSIENKINRIINNLNV